MRSKSEPSGSILIRWLMYGCGSAAAKWDGVWHWAAFLAALVLSITFLELFRVERRKGSGVER